MGREYWKSLKRRSCKGAMLWEAMQGGGIGEFLKGEVAKGQCYGRCCKESVLEKSQNETSRRFQCYRRHQREGESEKSQNETLQRGITMGGVVGRGHLKCLKMRHHGGDRHQISFKTRLVRGITTGDVTE